VPFGEVALNLIQFGSKMFDRSFLRTSHQLWKVWVFVLIQLTALALFVFASSSQPFGISETLAALALSLASFAWVCWSVECPNCKSKLMWRGARKNPLSVWLSDVILLESCPGCNFRG
jgi:hypothetical protein